MFTPRQSATITCSRASSSQRHSSESCFPAAFLQYASGSDRLSSHRGHSHHTVFVQVLFHLTNKREWGVDYAQLDASILTPFIPELLKSDSDGNYLFAGRSQSGQKSH